MAVVSTILTAAIYRLDHTSLNERLGLYPTGIAPRYRLVERNAGVAGRRVGSSLRAESAGLLDQVDLGAGHCGGGDEGAVLGADEREVALGDVGAVLGGFELALESSYPGHALLGYTLLETNINNVLTSQHRHLNKTTKSKANVCRC